jgi:hypothetical protein
MYMMDYTILYDYYDIPIYYNQFVKNIETSGFIQIQYRNTERNNRPNITILPEQRNYFIKTLYIYRDTLVIEHDSPMYNELVFVCFPLKQDDSMTNSIDTIVEHAMNPTRTSQESDIIQLNQYIESSTCMVSKQENMVIHVKDGIRISSDTSHFQEIPSFLFAGSPQEEIPFLYIEEQKKVEGFDTQVIDCKPFDDSENNDITLVSAKDSSDKMNSELMKTATYFILFIVVSSITYTGLPVFYNAVVLPSFKDHDKKGMLRLINMMFILWAFSVGFSLVLYSGSMDDSTTASTAGLCIIAMTCLIICCFIFNKDLMDHIVPDTASSENIYTILKYLFTFGEIFRDNVSSSNMILGFIFFLLLMVGFCVYYFINPEQSFGIFLTLLIGIPLALFIVVCFSMKPKVTPLDN